MSRLYTVISPEGNIAHVGTRLVEARRAARRISLVHSPGGRTVVLAAPIPAVAGEGEPIIAFYRPRRGDGKAVVQELVP